MELFNPITRLFTIGRMLFIMFFALCAILIDWRTMHKRGLVRESHWVLILNGGLIGLSIGICIALLVFT